MKEVGNGMTCKRMGNLENEKELRNIEEELKRGDKIKEDQGLQEDWGRVEKSKYWEIYKELKYDAEKEKYLERRDIEE